MQRQEYVLDTIFKPGYNVYFACDGSNAYWGIPIIEKDRYKTAFNTPKGQYCYRRLGQGLTGAPFTYSRFVNMVYGEIPPNKDGIGKEPRLDGCHEGLNFAHFMDDSYGSADSFDTLYSFLKNHFFPRVTWARMALNPGKSVFFVRQIPVLGLVGGNGIRPSDDKVKVIEEYPSPTSYAEVEAVLYLTPFLRRFIPGRAEHARIMKNCLVEDKETGQVFFVWTARHQKSFEAIKRAIVENSVFTPDYDQQFHLAADASGKGMGTVLFQLNGHPPNTKLTPGNRKDMKIIQFISQRFTEAEMKYTNSEREALAVIKGLMESRHMVIGSAFQIMVYTDHSALTTLLQGDSARGRIANWQSMLGEFEMRIIHLPGKEMELADGLLRLPVHCMGPSGVMDEDNEEEDGKPEMKVYDPDEVLFSRSEQAKPMSGIKRPKRKEKNKGEGNKGGVVETNTISAVSTTSTRIVSNP